MVEILCRQKDPGRKIRLKFLGPYIITKSKRNDRYDVRKVWKDIEGPINISALADGVKSWREFRDDIKEDLEDYGGLKPIKEENKSKRVDK